MTRFLHGLPDLDQVGVAVEAEYAAADGGDLEWAPGGFGDEEDLGVAGFFEAGEAVLDLRGELGGCLFGGVGEGQFDLDTMFLWDARDTGAWSVGVGGDGDGADEAQVDDVAGERGVEAVAQSVQNVRFGQHQQVLSPRQKCAKYSKQIL